MFSAPPPPRELDPEHKNYVTVDTLADVLTTLGEPLTQLEVDAVIEVTGVNRMGVVYYESRSIDSSS